MPIERRGNALRLLSASEHLCLAVSIAAVTVGAVVRLARGMPPLWIADLTPVVALAVVLITLGLWLRHKARAPRLSLFVIYMALFAIFTVAMTIFNASLLPIAFPLIDDQLVVLDAWTGFDWLAYVAWFTEAPRLTRFLGFVYGTHLIQITLMILTLSMLQWHRRLEQMTLTAILGAGMTVGFWARFPSFGPSPHLPLSPEVAEATGLAFEAHADFMMNAAEQGVTVMTGEDLAGLVGFPSFHIMMALLAIWHLRGTPLFWPLVVFNLFMVPATLLHGAHHLADIWGGLAGFALAAWAAMRLHGTLRKPRVNPSATDS